MFRLAGALSLVSIILSAAACRCTPPSPRGYSFPVLSSVQTDALAVDRLEMESFFPASSCAHTIQEIPVPQGVSPTAFLFRIYPIEGASGCLVVQLVENDAGAPGMKKIQEWTISHDGKGLFFDNLLRLDLAAPLSPGTYWIRFIDSCAAVSRLTFNCKLVEGDGLTRIVNENGYKMDDIIGYGLLE